MGVGTIMEARCCLILANGQNKAEAWAGMIEGPITAQLAASALQLHPWTIAVSEPGAASKLKNLAYYQHVDRETQDQPLLPPWILQPALDPRRVAVAAL
jgi:glucosamine-6-phosphate deaminase